MASPLDRVTNDFALKLVPPESQTDPRVPTAEELTLSNEILAYGILRTRTRRGWASPPQITTAPPLEVIFSGGKMFLPEHPEYQIQFDTSIILPALPGGGGLIKKDSLITLISVVAEVGADQDAVLGQMTFQYLEGDETNQTLQTVAKENTRRYRAFWLIAVSDNPIVVDTFISTLPVDAVGDRVITVSNTNSTGFPLGATYQVYALDPAWSTGTYKVLPQFVEAMPLCAVQRLQNFTDQGYTWGINQEDDLESAFVVKTPPTSNTETSVSARLRQIAVGHPGPEVTLKRTVQNLVAGAVAGNPGREGVSAASPNGSTALANDQRIHFINEARLQKVGADLVTVANDGSGRPEVSTPLNTQSPLGSSFSPERTDHKIYTLDGKEESAFGSFTNLGGTGTLTWRGGSNTTILPGQQVYFVPAIQYPSGSGFTIPFSDVEAAWLNAAAIPSANIRSGPVDDLENYEDPGGSDYFVVFGPERAGLLYIYRRYQVTTDANGVALAPAGAKACLAFIEGVAGRIDAPVKAGLTPSTTYNALLYYTPKINETWQLQLKYCEYQGTGEADFIDGATVVSPPSTFINTQGGGNFIFQGAGDTQFSTPSMHLPRINSGIRPHEMYSPVFLVGHENPTWFQEVALQPASGAALPVPGQTLSIAMLSGIHDRSLACEVFADGVPMGFLSPSLSRPGIFQVILAFLAKKGDAVRLIVATHISSGGNTVVLSSASSTAIDTFLI